MSVTIYTTPSCSVCKTAKRDMLKQGIIYEEKDVESDTQAFEAMMDATGMSAVPQFQIGEEWLVGYSKEVIDRATSDEDEFEFAGVGGQVYETCESCEG